MPYDTPNFEELEKRTSGLIAGVNSAANRFDLPAYSEIRKRLASLAQAYRTEKGYRVDQTRIDQIEFITQLMLSLHLPKDPRPEDIELARRILVGALLHRVARIDYSYKEARGSSLYSIFSPNYDGSRAALYRVIMIHILGPEDRELKVKALGETAYSKALYESIDALTFHECCLAFETYLNEEVKQDVESSDASPKKTFNYDQFEYITLNKENFMEKGDCVFERGLRRIIDVHKPKAILMRKAYEFPLCIQRLTHSLSNITTSNVETLQLIEPHLRVLLNENKVLSKGNFLHLCTMEILAESSIAVSEEKLKSLATVIPASIGTESYALHSGSDLIELKDLIQTMSQFQQKLILMGFYFFALDDAETRIKAPLTTPEEKKVLAALVTNYKTILRLNHQSSTDVDFLSIKMKCLKQAALYLDGNEDVDVSCFAQTEMVVAKINQLFEKTDALLFEVKKANQPIPTL